MRWRVIEVVRVGETWTWTMIGICGRVLAYTAETFACDSAAHEAAKAFRLRCWALGAERDHRQGVCI